MPTTSSNRIPTFKFELREMSRIIFAHQNLKLVEELLFS